MQKNDLLKYSFSALILAAIALQWYLDEKRAEHRNKELVQSINFSGHRYDLYFHRKSPYYNTITKDGEVVFDGRERPDLKSCIHQLEIESSRIFRRCYIQADKKVDREPLP